MSSSVALQLRQLCLGQLSTPSQAVGALQGEPEAVGALQGEPVQPLLTREAAKRASQGSSFCQERYNLAAL